MNSHIRCLTKSDKHVILYLKYFVDALQNIKFKKIGGPTTEDIIKASAADAAR